MITTKPGFLLTGKTTLTIKRTSAGSYVNGRWVDGTTVAPAPTITANVQPANTRDLLLLPESERTKEWVKVYTTDLIRNLREGVNGWAADEFTWNGDTYRVMRVKRYQMGVLDHYKALAARVELTPN